VFRLRSWGEGGQDVKVALTPVFPIPKCPVTSFLEVSFGFGGAECGLEGLSEGVAGFLVRVGLDMVRGQVRMRSTEKDYARTSEI
jgi:hypothetical protein